MHLLLIAADIREMLHANSWTMKSAGAKRVLALAVKGWSCLRRKILGKPGSRRRATCSGSKPGQTKVSSTSRCRLLSSAASVYSWPCEVSALSQFVMPSFPCRGMHDFQMLGGSVDFDISHLGTAFFNRAGFLFCKDAEGPLLRV